MTRACYLGRACDHRAMTGGSFTWYRRTQRRPSAKIDWGTPCGCEIRVFKIQHVSRCLVACSKADADGGRHIDVVKGPPEL